MRVVTIMAVAGGLLAIAIGVAGLKLHNAGLREEADGWRRRNEKLAAARAENRRLREVVGRGSRPGTNPAGDTASVSPSAVAGEATDPLYGPAPLDAFRNVGRGTPNAAFQTALWAAVKGDDAALAAALALKPTGRAQAEAMLARLPETERAKYGSPEKLVGTFVSAGVLMRDDRFQILGEDYADPTRAVVRIRSGAGKEDSFPMELGPGGWQMSVPDQALTLIDRILKTPASTPGGAKRER